MLGGNEWDDGNDVANMSHSQAKWAQEHGWFPVEELSGEDKYLPRLYAGTIIQVMVSK